MNKVERLIEEINEELDGLASVKLIRVSLTKIIITITKREATEKFWDWSHENPAVWADKTFAEAYAAYLEQESDGTQKESR